MNEPVRSAGSRSGVNWARVNSMPSVCANDRAASVLPSPGKSSSSTCPPARIPARTSRRESDLPITTERDALEDGGGLSRWPGVGMSRGRGHSSSILSDQVAELGHGVARMPVVGLVAVPTVAGDQVGQERPEQLGDPLRVVGVAEPVDLAEPALGQVGDLPEHGVVGLARGLVHLDQVAERRGAQVLARVRPASGRGRSPGQPRVGVQSPPGRGPRPRRWSPPAGRRAGRRGRSSAPTGSG